MSVNQDSETKPWYRQFWCWFVFAPLIIIIIVCAFTVSIAVRNSDDVIIDNYYKEGRMINQTFDQDKRARALELEAEINFDRENGEIRLVFGDKSANQTLPDTLLLVMSHPAKQDLDQFINLSTTGKNQYRGELTERPENAWYLLVYSVSEYNDRDKAEWIIAGQLDFSDREKAVLRPRIQ
jgi:hypothetical protein